MRQDFNGLEIVANYAEGTPNYLFIFIILKHFIFLEAKPLCWTEKDGTIYGPFKDALDVAARQLNLSLRFQKTLPKNAMKWFIKYEF